VAFFEWCWYSYQKGFGRLWFESCSQITFRNCGMHEHIQLWLNDVNLTAIDRFYCMF